MPKLVLEEFYDFDFGLIGLACHAKKHNLCWELNQELNWDLERQEDIRLTNKGTNSYFPLYTFEDEDNFKTFHLIGNRYQGGYLVPEQKQVDFFIQILGEDTEEMVNIIRQKLTAVKVVLMSFEIDPEGLKSKKNLLI